MTELAIGYARVVNIRVDMAPDSQPEEGEVVIPVDRRHAVLGNRHFLWNKLDPVERAKVLALYEQDLDQDFSVKGPMYLAIRELAVRVINGERLALQCNCRPLPCHADIIVARINQMVEAFKAGCDF